jgi:hypothetical protein
MTLSITSRIPDLLVFFFFYTFFLSLFLVIDFLNCSYDILLFIFYEIQERAVVDIDLNDKKIFY